MGLVTFGLEAMGTAYGLGTVQYGTDLTGPQRPIGWRAHRHWDAWSYSSLADAMETRRRVIGRLARRQRFRYDGTHAMHCIGQASRIHIRPRSAVGSIRRPNPHKNMRPCVLVFRVLPRLFFTASARDVKAAAAYAKLKLNTQNGPQSPVVSNMRVRMCVRVSVCVWPAETADDAVGQHIRANQATMFRPLVFYSGRVCVGRSWPAHPPPHCCQLHHQRSVLHRLQKLPERGGKRWAQRTCILEILEWA